LKHLVSSGAPTILGTTDGYQGYQKVLIHCEFGKTFAALGNIVKPLLDSLPRIPSSGVLSHEPDHASGRA
jgi:hypothetical protein